MKKLIFQYKNRQNGKTKTNIEVWFYPIRTLIISVIGVAGYLIWKAVQ